MSSEQVSEEAPSSPEIHFEPIVSLPAVEVKSLEENEEAVLKLRAKLYRFETSGDEKEWKERGVGEVKILKHGGKGTYRILMRRDKTYKICANHYITKDMSLQPNCGSDRAWVWSAVDFADEQMKNETLAIRFSNAENARKFKTAFLECQEKIEESSDEEESKKLAKELEGLKVKESNNEGDNESEQEKKDSETVSTDSKANDTASTVKQETETESSGKDHAKEESSEDQK